MFSETSAPEKNDLLYEGPLRVHTGNKLQQLCACLTMKRVLLN
jgi:hypothetical protein